MQLDNGDGKYSWTLCLSSPTGYYSRVLVNRKVVHESLWTKSECIVDTCWQRFKAWVVAYGVLHCYITISISTSCFQSKENTRHKVTLCHLAMSEQRMCHCVCCLYCKDQLPFHMKGGVAIWQFWLSKALCSDVLLSQHRHKMEGSVNSAVHIL